LVAIHTKLKIIVLLYDNDAIVNSLYVSRLFCERNSVVTLRVATSMLASHSPPIHLVGGKILERVHTYIYTKWFNFYVGEKRNKAAVRPK